MKNPPESSTTHRLLPLFNERADTMGERLGSLHRQIAATVPEVDQIACVLHDPDTGMLKTFVDSSHAGAPLRRYEFPLAASRSLRDLVRLRSARIMDDIPAELPGAAPHTVHIRAAGFRSSYTVPLFDGAAFQGFLFMDSRQPAAFSAAVVQRLEVYVNLVRMLLSHELTAVRSLVGSIRVARDFALLQDVEATRHLDRMARYARMIALRLASRHELSDEFVEQVFLFAPLHDIGKVGIPDAILHKPKALTTEERVVMATHVELGVELVERLIGHFNLGHLAGIHTLRNIVAGHHELLDGSGYPRGLRGEDIPLEARIVTVADIFDALCSRRDYKAAWGMDESFALLEEMVAEGKLDGQCVEALAENRTSIRTIMDRYGGGSQ
jgi:HD-GYP domain-containing protein (c-di-GMP phosphodiesterase class II)